MLESEGEIATFNPYPRRSNWIRLGAWKPLKIRDGRVSGTHTARPRLRHVLLDDAVSDNCLTLGAPSSSASSLASMASAHRRRRGDDQSDVKWRHGTCLSQ